MQWLLLGYGRVIFYQHQQSGACGGPPGPSLIISEPVMIWHDALDPTRPFQLLLSGWQALISKYGHSPCKARTDCLMQTYTTGNEVNIGTAQVVGSTLGGSHV